MLEASYSGQFNSLAGILNAETYSSTLRDTMESAQL